MEVWTQIRAQEECYMKMKAGTRWCFHKAQGCQGLPANHFASPPEARRERWDRFILLGCRRNQPCQQPDLRFLDSSSVRQWISEHCLWYSSPEKAKTVQYSQNIIIFYVIKVRYHKWNFSHFFFWHTKSSRSGIWFTQQHILVHTSHISSGQYQLMTSGSQVGQWCLKQPVVLKFKFHSLTTSFLNWQQAC